MIFQKICPGVALYEWIWLMNEFIDHALSIGGSGSEGEDLPAIHMAKQWCHWHSICLAIGQLSGLG